MPRVSVIMSFYNNEATLPKAIESILEQTFEDWEFILCDDGSTDRSFEIAKAYADSCGRITLLHNDANMRLSFSLNKCLEAASGAYIARMDADDESLPGRLAAQVEFLDAHPEYDLVSSRAIVFDENGTRGVRGRVGEPGKNEIFMGVPYLHPTVIIRKSAFDKLGGYTVSEQNEYSQDYDLWVRFTEQGFRGYRLEQPLYRYYESLDNCRSRGFKRQTRFLSKQMQCCIRLHAPFHCYVYPLITIISMLTPPFLKYARRNLLEKNA